MAGRTLSGTLVISLSAGLPPQSIQVARQPTPQSLYQPHNSMAGLDLWRMLGLGGQKAAWRCNAWNINDLRRHLLSAGKINPCILSAKVTKWKSSSGMISGDGSCRFIPSYFLCVYVRHHERGHVRVCVRDATVIRSDPMTWIHTWSRTRASH